MQQRNTFLLIQTLMVSHIIYSLWYKFHVCWGLDEVSYLNGINPFRLNLVI